MIRGARDQVAELDAQAERDEELERSLQQLAGVVARANARETLVRQRDGLVELGERLVKSAAALANNRVTAAVLTSLDDVEREIAILTARLEAAAPEVAIELGAAGAGKISIGDAVLAGNAVHAAIDPLTIRVADVATITVTPPKAASAVEIRTSVRMPKGAFPN